MTLSETFAPHTNTEFPPKKVFFLLDGQPRSMATKDIQIFEGIFEGIEDVMMYSHIKGGDVELQQLRKL
jgi:hypothetical protein